MTIQGEIGLIVKVELFSDLRRNCVIHDKETCGTFVDAIVIVFM